jgi:hypothetical protein
MESDSQEVVKQKTSLTPTSKVKDEDHEKRLRLCSKGREGKEKLTKRSGDYFNFSPSVLRRTSFSASTENENESTEIRDERSCKAFSPSEHPKSNANKDEHVGKQSATTHPPEFDVDIAKEDSLNVQRSSDFLEFSSSTCSSQHRIWDNQASDHDSGTVLKRSLGDTGRGSDFDLTFESCVEQANKSMGDTMKGSDFDEKLKSMKTKPKVPLKPWIKSKHRPTFYTGEDENSKQEREVAGGKSPEKQSRPVDERRAATKPTLPPRKPLKK